jgi:hypothetical protein
MRSRDTDDEIRKIPLSEDFHGPRVGLCSHIVFPEKLATEFDQGRLSFASPVTGLRLRTTSIVAGSRPSRRAASSFMVQSDHVDHRRSEPDRNGFHFMKGPLVRLVVLARRRDNG